MSAANDDDEPTFVPYKKTRGISKGVWTENQLKKYIDAFPNCTKEMIYAWINPGTPENPENDEILTMSTIEVYLSNIRKN